MSKFQRRHYIALATLLNHLEVDCDKKVELDELIDELCRMLKRDNCNFNENTFRSRIWDF